MAKYTIFEAFLKAHVETQHKPRVHGNMHYSSHILEDDNEATVLKRVQMHVEHAKRVRIADEEMYQKRVQESVAAASGSRHISGAVRTTDGVILGYVDTVDGDPCDDPAGSGKPH